MRNYKSKVISVEEGMKEFGEYGVSEAVMTAVVKMVNGDSFYNTFNRRMMRIRELLRHNYDIEGIPFKAVYRGGRNE